MVGTEGTQFFLGWDGGEGVLPKLDFEVEIISKKEAKGEKSNISNGFFYFLL